MRMTTLHSQMASGNPAAGLHLDEIAGLLAAGILRLRLRGLADASETQKTFEKPLDAGARRSVHASRT